MIRLEGDTLPLEARGAVPPILFGDLVRDVPGIPVQIGFAATLADNCGITASVLMLTLGGADLAELLAGVPPSGVVQIDNEWLAYDAILTSPPRLTISARGYRETDPAPHAKGATVYFVETRPLYVLAYVPPGCSYPPDALVQLRVNDNAETPPCTVRLADERLVPGERFISAEFDASKAFFAQAPARLPSSAVLIAGAGTRGTGGAAGILRARSGSAGLRHVVALGPMRAGRGGGGAYPRTFGGRDTGTARNMRILLPPPSARIAGLGQPSPVFAGNGGQRIVSLRQGTLGRVTADLKGLRDTAGGRYSGVPLGGLVQPAAIVRLILEETYGEIDPSVYYEPAWLRTRARHAALGITWRLVWTGDAFEPFRESAQASGNADLYVDDEGRWRYAFRDPLAAPVGTITARELIGDPALGWTAGREIITVLEVAWGEGVQGGTFTLDSPMMQKRHDENHGGESLPYAATEAVARVLGRAALSRRDRPRQALTCATSHAWLGLTLTDRVFVDTPLLQLYGAKRVPFEIIGLTDRGDARVLTLLEADPLALELLLSGTLAHGATIELPLTGTYDDALLAAVLALAGTLVVTRALDAPLAGTLVVPASFDVPLAGTLGAAGVVAKFLAGTLVKPGVVSIGLAGTVVAAGVVSVGLTGTLDDTPPPPTFVPDGFRYAEPGMRIDY